MFENPRRSRQPRNFTTNVPKILDLKSSSEQIFCRKLSLGAPDHLIPPHDLVCCWVLSFWHENHLEYLASLASLTLSLLSSLSSSCALFWMKEKLHLIPLTLSCFSNYVAYQPPLLKPQFGKNSQSDIEKIK